jgi:hypothetical protein
MHGGTRSQATSRARGAESAREATEARQQCWIDPYYSFAAHCAAPRARAAPVRRGASGSASPRATDGRGCASHLGTATGGQARQTCCILIIDRFEHVWRAGGQPRGSKGPDRVRCLTSHCRAPSGACHQAGGDLRIAMTWRVRPELGIGVGLEGPECAASPHPLCCTTKTTPTDLLRTKSRGHNGLR